MQFKAPAADLILNAAIPAPDRRFAAGQAYVMAWVFVETGKVVPGFEAEKCVLQNIDRADAALVWSGKSVRELGGRSIRLRFALRGANIYAVNER